jgi:DNA-binding GntR family transcriptional regulator
VDERNEVERLAAAEEIAPRALRILEAWRGSGQPLARDELARRLGCSDRVLRAAMALLRMDGHLVIAEDEGGYRLAKSIDEVGRYVASLKSRVENLRLVIRAMEAEAAREFPNDLQMRLEL